MIARVGVLILVFTSFSMAQRHHLTYTGAHFSGDSTGEHRNNGNWVSSNSASHVLYAPVSFPDSANGMQVTRLSCTLVDTSTSGRIGVTLVKVDRWTGYAINVCYLTSSLAFSSSSVQYLNVPKSQMTGRGIDNNRWAWYLMAYFSEGDTPLNLYHVTIRYE